MVKQENKIKLEHSEITLRDDSIVQVQFCDDCEIDAENCEEIALAYDKILENKKYPILHLPGKYVRFTEDAREFSVSKRGTQYSKAEAYVFTSLAHKIIADFYFKINNPPVPTHFFNNEKDAVDWLTTYL